MNNYGMDKIEVLLANFPLYAEDLGIDQKEPSGRFKWFLASILFGARISEKIVSNTYKSFERSGIGSLDRQEFGIYILINLNFESF